MNRRRVLFGLITVGAVVLVGWQIFLMVNRDKSFGFYVNRLDAWVSEGGDVAAVESGVVENCGKLIITQTNVFEQIGFFTYDREEFDFRVDVCTKMTVHRVWPQPEFEDPKIIKMICESNEFEALCRRSGFFISS